MKVKDAKEKLENLIASLNIYSDDADLVINVYDNCGGDYPTDFDKWLLYNVNGKVILNIE